MIKQLIASPSVGERMPNLTLTSSQGQRVQIEAYRHQSNLVAAFLFGAADEPNNRLLDELAKRIGDFRVEDATILAVVKAEAEGATQRQRGQSRGYWRSWAQPSYPTCSCSNSVAVMRRGVWAAKRRGLFWEQARCSPSIACCSRHGWG